MKSLQEKIEEREEALRRARKEGFDAAKITTRRESDGASVPLYPEFFHFEAARAKNKNP